MLTPKPEVSAIEKGAPGFSFLSNIITSKYADHLPLYTQEQILNNSKIHANYALLEIGKLYVIEKRTKDLVDEEKLKIRKIEAIPIFLCAFLQAYGNALADFLSVMVCVFTGYNIR